MTYNNITYIYCIKQNIYCKRIQNTQKCYMPSNEFHFRIKLANFINYCFIF